MQVSWYEQSQADVRPGDDWLSEWERLHLATLKVPKRRSDWLLGRWTAKYAVTGYYKLPCEPADLSTIEIRPDETGAPEVLIHGELAGVAISLSHRDGLGACAVAKRPSSVGCDVETVEPRSAEFVEDYFTPEEQTLIARAIPADRFVVVALLWSAKESALKALRAGLRRSTRCVSVEFVSAIQLSPSTLIFDVHSPFIAAVENWHELFVKCSEGMFFAGKWCLNNGVVRTFAVLIP